MNFFLTIILVVSLEFCLHWMCPLTFLVTFLEFELLNNLSRPGLYLSSLIDYQVISFNREIRCIGTSILTLNQVISNSTSTD